MDMNNKDLIAELRSLVLKMRTGSLALIDESVLARAANALEAADGEWQPAETAPEGVTVLTQHVDDPHPVPAYRTSWDDEGDIWRREIEGPEDTFYGGGRHQELYRTPTHYRLLPPRPPKEQPND